MQVLLVFTVLVEFPFHSGSFDETKFINFVRVLEYVPTQRECNANSFYLLAKHVKKQSSLSLIGLLLNIFHVRASLFSCYDFVAFNY